MAKRRPDQSVREPIQVYLATEERAELDRLASLHRISRAEVLRRGIRSFAVESAAGQSPVFDLMAELGGRDWPPDVAADHDAHLADAYGSEITEDT
jgi:hypothetical protein